MGSAVNPKPWVPYMNTKDCSQGFCSLYCPQWCYIIFPPPPPFELTDDSPGPSFSPIVIAIIGILASAFLLVSYYAIISKYCKDRDSSSRLRENHFPAMESEESQDHSNHAPWHNSENGLDEALIKSIKVFKYKKGDGFIEGTDCSVCLSEFQDDESLRLLPKCSHAFHVMCIDTWFRSHSNCPLCRANIALVNALPPLTESPPENDPPLHSNPPEIENVATDEDLEMGIREGESEDNIVKSPSTQASDMGNSGAHSSTSDIRNDEDEVIIRRSVSMDCMCQGRLSIADVLRIDLDEDDEIEQSKLTNDVGASKWPLVGTSRPGNMTRMLHCVSSPIIKRSFSSGRFLFSKAGRGRNLEIPL